MGRAAEVFKAIGRRPDYSRTLGKGAASGAVTPTRLAGSVPTNYENVQARPNDGELGTPNGRTGNDWIYPDLPHGRFDVGTVNGDRLQNLANTHLSEGPNPGRIPRGWNNRMHGKVGRNVSGNPSGDDFFINTISGEQSGGIGDQMYVPHTPTPRGVGIARAYMRTVDDGAFVPGVYISEPTRR